MLFLTRTQLRLHQTSLDPCQVLYYVPQFLSLSCYHLNGKRFILNCALLHLSLRYWMRYGIITRFKRIVVQRLQEPLIANFYFFTTFFSMVRPHLSFSTQTTSLIDCLPRLVAGTIFLILLISFRFIELWCLSSFLTLRPYILRHLRYFELVQLAYLSITS